MMLVAGAQDGARARWCATLLAARPRPGKAVQTEWQRSATSRYTFPEDHRRANLLRTTSPVPRPIAAYLAKVELRRFVRCDVRRAWHPPRRSARSAASARTGITCTLVAALVGPGAFARAKGGQSGAVLLARWPNG